MLSQTLARAKHLNDGTKIFCSSLLIAQRSDFIAMVTSSALQPPPCISQCSGKPPPPVQPAQSRRLLFVPQHFVICAAGGWSGARGAQVPSS